MRDVNQRIVWVGPRDAYRELPGSRLAPVGRVGPVGTGWGIDVALTLSMVKLTIRERWNGELAVVRGSCLVVLVHLVAFAPMSHGDLTPD